MKKPYPFAVNFSEISLKDLAHVGGKNCSLGEMKKALSPLGIPVPDGFAVTAEAYKHIFTKSSALKDLQALFDHLDTKNTTKLQAAGKKAREIIENCPIPSSVSDAIIKHYRALGLQCGDSQVAVAVRSSATAEDLPEASFAGQQASFLHIRGEQALLKAYKQCLISLFTDRAIAYRSEKKIAPLSVALAVGVQLMVRSDVGSSGVIFTLDTETGCKDITLITAGYGLGELIVQGIIEPDEFLIHKPTLNQGFASLITKRLGSKQEKMIFSDDPNQPVISIPTSQREQANFSLKDNDVLTLARFASAIERHYSKIYQRWTPMDIEWAKDGITGALYIVQARPETVQSQKRKQYIERYRLTQKANALLQGKAVGTKICHGKVCTLKDVASMASFQKGEILVTEMTNPDWVPLMRIAGGIITDRGGRTSHAAIVSRELGLPCIVGTKTATKTLIPGSAITLDCSLGEDGYVYQGSIPFTVQKKDVSKLPKISTNLMVNIGIPDEALAASTLPSCGVGLARIEFIISEIVKIHPLALIHYESIKDLKVRQNIAELTAGYSDKKEYFIDKLAEGLGKIAAAFYPRDVIIRFSDFKTNEYRNLIGGSVFEPEEENPMLGWRGASRYYHPSYSEGFSLECLAVQKIRRIFGLTNTIVMVPVCRTVDEGKKVIAAIRSNIKEKKGTKLKIFMMCELPCNALLMKEFCSIFDGFSIGSNDLTQTTLGVDRDSNLVSDLYDENNPAVKALIKEAIIAAKLHKKKIGICGEAPSTSNSFLSYLLDCGIDSISTSPSSLLDVYMKIAKKERKGSATALPKRKKSKKKTF